MVSYFEVKVKYVKIDDDGRERKVSEVYLVDAVSCTDAEARLIKELQTMVRGESVIGKVAKSNIVEVFPNEDGEWWWKAKISIVAIDEKAGKEKRINEYFLVAADDINQAVKRLEEGLAYILVPYSTVSIGVSQIVDVFPYFPEEINSIPAHLTPLSEAKDAVIGRVGTERRDDYEAEVQQELDLLEEVYSSDDEITDVDFEEE